MELQRLGYDLAAEQFNPELTRRSWNQGLFFAPLFGYFPLLEVTSFSPVSYSL